MQFALYCDSLLKESEDGKLVASHSQLPTKEFPQIVIQKMLAAMALGSSTARDRFPRLLELLASYPHIHDLFSQEAGRVPSWMFLRWMAQMMALMDQPEGPIIVDILTRVAELYPQAVFYPFTISSEDWNPNAKRIIAPLQSKLNKPLLRSFVTSLQALTHPEHRFKDWIDSLKPLMKSKKRSAEDKENIQQIYLQMLSDVFDSHSGEHGAYSKQSARNSLDR